jgi:hypothetical protein
MANTIKHKRGVTDPQASDLVVGELAINTSDGGVFTLTDGGTVVEVSGSGGGGGGIASVSADTSPQLGGNLDVNTYSITSASNGDVNLDPDGSGVVVFKGNATKGSGQFKLNCEQNSHGIVIKGPAHSAAANYTLTLESNPCFSKDCSAWIAHLLKKLRDAQPLCILRLDRYKSCLADRREFFRALLHRLRMR